MKHLKIKIRDVFSGLNFRVVKNNGQSFLLNTAKQLQQNALLDIQVGLSSPPSMGLSFPLWNFDLADYEYIIFGDFRFRVTLQMLCAN